MEWADAVLETNQKECVQESWKQVRDKTSGLEAIGTSLFLRLFEENPNLKKTFWFAVSKTDAELTTVPEFLSHVTAVAATVDRLVSALEDPPYTDVLLYLRDLGRLHLSMGVQEDAFTSVREALLETLSATLEVGVTLEQSRAWNALFDIIEGAMMAGMRSAQKQQSKEPPTDLNMNLEQEVPTLNPQAV